MSWFNDFYITHDDEMWFQVFTAIAMKEIRNNIGKDVQVVLDNML